jgi:hypothetical protein
MPIRFVLCEISPAESGELIAVSVDPFAGAVRERVGRIRLDVAIAPIVRVASGAGKPLEGCSGID